MALAIVVEPNQKQLGGVQALLLDVKNGMPKTMASAINDTLSGVKSAASREARKAYNLSSKKIKSTLTTVKASAATGRLSGSVRSLGRPVSYINFGAKPNTDEPYRRGGKRPAGGVSVLIKHADGRQIVPRSFVVARGGRYVVFQRQAGAARQPIEVLRGPSVPQMIQDPAVIKEIQAQANTRLADRLNHHAKRLLEQARYRRAA